MRRERKQNQTRRLILYFLAGTAIVGGTIWMVAREEPLVVYESGSFITTEGTASAAGDGDSRQVDTLQDTFVRALQDAEVQSLRKLPVRSQFLHQLIGESRTSIAGQMAFSPQELDLIRDRSNADVEVIAQDDSRYLLIFKQDMMVDVKKR